MDSINPKEENNDYKNDKGSLDEMSNTDQNTNEEVNDNDKVAAEDSDEDNSKLIQEIEYCISKYKQAENEESGPSDDAAVDVTAKKSAEKAGNDNGKAESEDSDEEYQKLIEDIDYYIWKYRRAENKDSEVKSSDHMDLANSEELANTKQNFDARVSNTDKVEYEEFDKDKIYDAIHKNNKIFQEINYYITKYCLAESEGKSSDDMNADSITSSCEDKQDAVGKDKTELNDVNKEQTPTEENSDEDDRFGIADKKLMEEIDYYISKYNREYSDGKSNINKSIYNILSDSDEDDPFKTVDSKLMQEIDECISMYSHGETEDSPDMLSDDLNIEYNIMSGSSQESQEYTIEDSTIKPKKVVKYLTDSLMTDCDEMDIEISICTSGRITSSIKNKKPDSYMYQKRCKLDQQE